MKVWTMPVLAVVMLLAMPAFAGETHKVILKDGMISTTTIKAKVGDVVKIFHDDSDGIHALYSTALGHSFDLTKMKHGDHFDLRLKKAGTIDIQCHKMKAMQLTLIVSK